MISRLSNITLVLFFVLCAFGLYPVKYRVQDIKDRNAAMQQNLESEQINLQLLQAEWAYLNRAERLQQLANKHLAVEPMQSIQIKGWNDLPMKAQATVEVKMESR